jgi:hypothetical protein
LGQPFGVGHVSLTSGYTLDVVGIDHPGRNASGREARKHALPINAGALQDDQFDLAFGKPADERLHIALEAPELTRMLGDAAVLAFDEYGDDMLHPMYVESSDPSMNRFLIVLP